MNHPDPFDPNGLRWDGAGTAEPIARPPKRLPRHRPGEKFLRGPIPWDWLERAGRLPGKALWVGLLVWREAGCAKSRTVRFNLALAVALGMSWKTARRGLQALAMAKLVSIRHMPGRCLEVTLNDAQTRAVGYG